MWSYTAPHPPPLIFKKNYWYCIPSTPYSSKIFKPNTSVFFQYLEYVILFCDTAERYPTLLLITTTWNNTPPPQTPSLEVIYGNISRVH